MLACVMSREFTREAVIEFVPALIKYSEVLIKYSLLITHAEVPH